MLRRERDEPAHLACVLLLLLYVGGGLRVPRIRGRGGHLLELLLVLLLGVVLGLGRVERFLLLERLPKLLLLLPDDPPL